MIAIYYAYYNFARVHQTTKTTPAVAASSTTTSCGPHMTLKTTPAVAAGLVQRQWTMDDLVER